MQNPFYIPGDLTGTKVVPLEEATQKAILSVQEPEEEQSAETTTEALVAEPQEEFTVEDLL